MCTRCSVKIDVGVRILCRVKNNFFKPSLYNPIDKCKITLYPDPDVKGSIP